MIVIEMDSGNLIIKVYYIRTGKLVDYSIVYVVGEEE